MFSKIEKIELALMPIAGAASFASSSLLPNQMGVGHLILVMSGMLLLQSLIRDLAILASSKSRDKMPQERKMRCMCVESTVGITGIVAGAGIFAFGLGTAIPMPGLAWLAATLLTLGCGFGMKDFILQTNPWRIVRDKDHLNIVVSWRS